MTAARQTYWFAARVKPGYERMASKWDAANREHRQETIIERNLRMKGIECYLPCQWREAKHHRTKQWMEKRFPLIGGYIFVNLPRFNFEEVRAVDGVLCLLKHSRDSSPAQFCDDVMETLIEIEDKVYSEYVTERDKRIQAEAASANKATRKQIRRLFPPNSMAVIVEGAPFAGMTARVLGPSSGGKVKAIIEMLNGFTNVDVPLENLREAS